jgi:hypothetical protein
VDRNGINESIGAKRVWRRGYGVSCIPKKKYMVK